MDRAEDRRSFRARIADRLPPQRAPQESYAAEARPSPSVAPTNDKVGPASLDLLSTLNTELNRRLDQQWDTINQLDTKSGLMLTLALTVAGIVLSGHHTVLSIVTVATCVAAIWLNLNCLSVRAWSNAPTPDVLVDLEQADPARTYDRLIRAKAMSFDSNRQQLARKSDWLKISTWWMLLPMLLAAATILTAKDT